MSLKPLIMGFFSPASLQDYIPSLGEFHCPPQGSVGSSLVNLVRVRLERQMPTDVITCDFFAEQDIRRYESELLNVWVVKSRAKRRIRDGYRVERELIHRAMSESSADLCHANWTYEYAVSGLTQSALPCLVTVHDNADRILRVAGPCYLGSYLVTQWVLRKARHLSAVSPYIAGCLGCKVGRDIPMIPNTFCDWLWVHSNEISDAKPDGPKVIVSALDWTRGKNVRRALRAFQLVRRKYPGARYMLMGSGLAESGPAERWANARGLSEGVIFMGSLDYRDSLKRIVSADLLFHPSLEESFGSPVAEAMAMHVPIVAARDAEGVAWLMENGRYGQLVSGRSIDMMADAIVAALKNRSGSIVEGAADRIHELCKPGKVLNEYEELYARVMRE